MGGLGLASLSGFWDGCWPDYTQENLTGQWFEWHQQHLSGETGALLWVCNYKDCWPPQLNQREKTPCQSGHWPSFKQLKPQKPPPLNVHLTSAPSKAKGPQSLLRMAVAVSLEEHAPTSPEGPTPPPGLQIQEVKWVWEFAFLTRTWVTLTLTIWVPQSPWSEITGFVESHAFWARPDISMIFLLHLFFPSPQSQVDWTESFWREGSTPASLVLHLFLSLPWSYILLFGYLVLGLWTSVLIQEVVCTSHKHLLLTPLSEEVSRGVIGKGLKVSVTQSCPTLYNPMNYSPPVSSIQRIFQARMLEWAAFPFSRGSSQPRDWTQVSHITGRFFIIWASRERPGKSLDDSK